MNIGRKVFFYKYPPAFLTVAQGLDHVSGTRSSFQLALGLV